VQRSLAILLRLCLVAAFVPVLIAGSFRPSMPLALVLVVLIAVAWVSLRLWASPRWRPLGFVLAVAASAAVWSIVLLSVRVGA
jgi:hypothetical protein